MKKIKKLSAMLLAAVMLMTMVPFASQGAIGYPVAYVVYEDNSNDYFETLEEALAAVYEKGGELTLLQSAEISAPIKIKQHEETGKYLKRIRIENNDAYITFNGCSAFTISGDVEFTLECVDKTGIITGGGYRFIEMLGSPKVYIKGEGTYSGGIIIDGTPTIEISGGFFPGGLETYGGSRIGDMIAEGSCSFSTNGNYLDPSELGWQYYEAFYIAEHTHDYDYKIISEATCEKDAVQEGTCSCGAYSKVGIPGTALGHIYDEAGKCTRCNLYCDHIFEAQTHKVQIDRPWYGKAEGDEEPVWHNGFIRYVCPICNAVITDDESNFPIVEVKRADYTAFEEAFFKLVQLYEENEDSFTASFAASIRARLQEAEEFPADYITTDFVSRWGERFDEQAIVDAGTQAIIDYYNEALEMIESKAVVKPDFSEVEDILGDLGDIADATGSEEIGEIIEELEEKLEDFKEKAEDEDYSGASAEVEDFNKEIAEVIEQLNKCIAGEHIYGEYIYNNDATCTADGTKTAACEFCGHKDTVTAEGTKLEHTDENGDDLCDGCGATTLCPDCGREAHKGVFSNIVCLFIMLFNMILSMF